MPIFEFTAAEQSSPIFVSGGDLSTRPGSRTKITHPDLKGATLTIEQKMSNGEWWPTYKISENLATVIDTPHDAVLRISVLAGEFGTGAFEIAYQE